jgi:hypothetical protein
MAAANASPRAQRSAVLASPLHELTGFCPEVDCLAEGCRRDRMFAVSELASFYGRNRTVAEVLRRMRCSGGWWRACSGGVAGDGACDELEGQSADWWHLVILAGSA